MKTHIKAGKCSPMCTITQQRVEEKFALGMRGNTVNVRRRVGTQKVNVFAHGVRNTDGVETHGKWTAR